MQRVRNALPPLFLAAATASGAFADVAQQVTPTRQAYRVSGMCDFDQLRTAAPGVPGLPLNGSQHCAPAATADVLAYLGSATPGGVPGVRVDDWADRDAAEYASSNSLITVCGNVMQTNVFGNGTRYAEINRGYQFYLPSDRFTLLTVGGAAGNANGLSSSTVVQMLTSPLIPRPTASACVLWLQAPTGGSTFWTRAGGHCFAINQAIWELQTGKVELDICDPADSARIDPDEPTSAQSVFVSAIYNAVDGAYPLNPSWTITAGWMQGFASGTTRGVLASEQVVFPTTVYTTDIAGVVLRLVRPLRFEFEDASPYRPIATALSSAVTDVAFDFVSRRLYAVQGAGTGATLVVTDGLTAAATPVSLPSLPRKVAAGRFGEVFVLGTNGSANTLTRVQTTSAATPTQRTLPLPPDAVCYDDGADRLFAYHAATRTMYAIPRLESDPVVTSTVPLAAAVSGEASLAVNPDDGSVWLAGSGTAGRFSRLTIGASGAVESADAVPSSAIAAPTQLKHLGRGKVAFRSGTQLRVLTEQATAGTWAADTSSPLWGAVVGAALDISRERNNFRAGDPLLQASFAVLPTSTPVTRAPCPADLNLDGQVDGADLALLLGDWGADGFGDLDRNDTVDGADLGVLLAAWGPCA